MVEVIEGLLRRGLRQALSEAAERTTRWTVDWEGLLFPGRGAPPGDEPDRPDGPS
jgi:hypothetical protein